MLGRSFSLFLLLGSTAHASDPALELLSRYRTDSSDSQIPILLEQVALDRLNDRIPLLPEPVRNVNLRTAVDSQVGWYVDGLDLSSAMDHLYALTSGELAERAIMNHLHLPPQNWLGRRNHGEKQLANIQPSAGQFFEVVPEQSHLRMEYGTVGNGNGNFDSGEWARLDVAIKPTGEPVLFSTSASVASSDACVWASEVPNAKYGELPRESTCLGA